MNYQNVIHFLESLQIMPKTMPGLHKITKALEQTSWFSHLDEKKIIIVAGTNGKGTTSAVLQTLLMSANKKVGFYSSPHLVSTTERIRYQAKPINEDLFVDIFKSCENLIRQFELSHFEALTLMAGHYFFSPEFCLDLDYAIFEVGLGGLYDATNAFPHRYSVITTIDLDHTNILGHTIPQIAENKFGIVKNNNLVVHHQLPLQVLSLQQNIQQKTKSIWVPAKKGDYEVSYSNQQNALPEYTLKTEWGDVVLGMYGVRAVQNAMTALTLFELLGFSCKEHLSSLKQIDWPGRMQKINWPNLKCPVFLSGDHNPEGIRSLIEILKNFSYKKLHLIVGIGIDKNSDEILSQMMSVKNSYLYLTETPFKGRKISEYPEKYLSQAVQAESSVEQIFKNLCLVADKSDMVVVTGSLYLVGKVLSYKQGLNI